MKPTNQGIDYREQVPVDVIRMGERQMILNTVAVQLAHTGRDVVENQPASHSR